jgi:hypothetical protein
VPACWIRSQTADEQLPLAILGKKSSCPRLCFPRGSLLQVPSPPVPSLIAKPFRSSSVSSFAISIPHIPCSVGIYLFSPVLSSTPYLVSLSPKLPCRLCLAVLMPMNTQESSKMANPEKSSQHRSDLKSPALGVPSPGQQRNAMATIEDDDERLLARIGYRQVGNFAIRSLGGLSLTV